MMNVRSPKPWDKFDACMTEKSTVLVIYIHHRVKWIVFAVPIEFCDELGLAILNKNIYL